MSTFPSLPCPVVVAARYDAAYPEPLCFREGKQVKILAPPEDWHGWHWCETTNGEKRWVPLQFLTVQGSVGKLNRDYEATELSVEPGEELTLLEITAGWGWCENSDGKLGWVPIENLRPA